MDSSNRTTTDLPLEEFLALAVKELRRVGYSGGSITHYHTTWRRLIAFAKDHGLGDRYSEELAERFVDASLPHVRERLGRTQKAQRQAVFAVKVLGAFSRDGRIEPFRMDLMKYALPAAMKKPLRDYEQYCKDYRQLNRKSVVTHVRLVAQFLLFLDSRNLRSLQELRPADVTAFVVSRQHLRRTTVAATVSCLRQFLKYLAMRSTVGEDLSRALPSVRVTKDANIPAVWDPETVVKLLAAVDRSSPRGKRDYAILLLAARLGLRTGDICLLRLDDLDWDAAIIDIMQSKTRAALRLPISEEIGEALIDYLRFGRPSSEHREVFLKLRPPFVPFGDDAHLYKVMVRWRRAAGIDFRGRRQQGLRSLRHTLATQLLRAETPIHVISEILGHASSATTMIYAKADTEALRGAALDPEEARHVE